MKIRRFLCCVLLLAVTFVWGSVSEAVHYGPNRVDIIVDSLLKPHASLPQSGYIKWDYRGYLSASLVPYFNRYLPPLVDPVANSEWPL